MKTHEIENELRKVVGYCPPTVLAEMVEYWSGDEEHLPLAQIALDEGKTNCGVDCLATIFIPGANDWSPDELEKHRDKINEVVARWIARGLDMTVQ